jgi:hypothetical protein
VEKTSNFVCGAKVINISHDCNAGDKTITRAKQWGKGGPERNGSCISFSNLSIFSFNEISILSL